MSLTLTPVSAQPTQPSLLPFRLVDKWVPRKIEGKINYNNLDVAFGQLPTADSRVDGMEVNAETIHRYSICLGLYLYCTVCIMQIYKVNLSKSKLIIFEKTST